MSRERRDRQDPDADDVPSERRHFETNAATDHGGALAGGHISCWHSHAVVSCATPDTRRLSIQHEHSYTAPEATIGSVGVSEPLAGSMVTASDEGLGALANVKAT